MCPEYPLLSVSDTAFSRADTLDDADDASSVGDPMRRARKSEAERRQYLEDDPNSGEVEPHRVFCKACDNWVELNPKLKFIMKLWNEHRKQCSSTKEGSERSVA